MNNTANEHDSGVWRRYFAAVIQGPVRLLMHAGYSALEAVDIVRQEFVRQFYTTPEFWRNDKPSALQCSMKTGLSRSMIEETRIHSEMLPSSRRNRAARVLYGWITDTDFHVDGAPRTLPISDPSHTSFRGLVAKYAADARVSPVLHDLEQAGRIRCTQDRVELVSQIYGLEGITADKLEISGYMAARLGDTTEYNLRNPDPGAYGDPAVNYGRHEGAHTGQYELLGPLYAPVYLFSGGFSGPGGNFLERGAQDYGSGRGSWW